MSVFLNILRLFMQKQIVCVCVCVFHLHSRVCLEPRLQIWVQAASAWGALCSCGTEVGGWVSRLGSCNVQWELFGTLIEGNCETSIFHFIHNWTYGYQECRSFSRILPVPQEIVKHTLLITTVQNGNLSFLDCQRLRALFHLLLVTFFLLLSTHPCLKR
jgi:hypothetical protein